MASNDDDRKLGLAPNLSFYLHPESSKDMLSDDSESNSECREDASGTEAAASLNAVNEATSSASKRLAGARSQDDKVLARLDYLEQQLRENDANFTSTLEHVVGEFVGRIQSLERIQATIVLENDLLRERIVKLEGGRAGSTDGQFNGAPNHVGLFLQEARAEDGQAQPGNACSFDKDQEGAVHKGFYRNASAAFGESSLQMFSSSICEEHPGSPQSLHNSDLSRSSSEIEEVETWFPESETSPGAVDNLSFAVGGWFSPREMRNLLRHGSVSDIHTFADKELAKKKSMNASTLPSKNSGQDGSFTRRSSLISPSSIPEDAEEEADSDDDKWGQMLAAEEAATAAVLSSSVDNTTGTRHPTDMTQQAVVGSNSINAVPSSVRQDEMLIEVNFDVRSVLKTVGGSSSTLTSLALRLGNIYGFFNMSDAICEIQTFTAFMDSVSSGYTSTNPYHNSLHAADVMLTANSYLEHSGVLFMCDDSGHAFDWQHLRFSLILASAVHDLGHPARMNPFMIASKHPLSVTYASSSGILEAMHADRFLDILRKPEHNVLEHLDKDSVNQVRETILELILATDLSKQSAILNAWNEKISSGDINLYSGAASTDHKLFLQIVIKAADVSNPAKPLPQYLFWTNRIMEEFYSQGDEEQHLGLPITSMPQCNRSKPSVAGGQKGFMMFVVKPVFEVLCDFAASVQSALPEGSSHTRGLESCMKNLTSNLEFWKRVEEEVPAEVLEVTCLPSDLPLGNLLYDDLQSASQLGIPGIGSVLTQPSKGLPSDEDLVTLDFCVYNVAKIVGANSTLNHIAPRLAMKAELTGDKSSGSLCNVASFKTFTKTVTLGYNSENPYHNSLHAADVMLTASTYFDHCGVLELIPTMNDAPPVTAASTNETIWNLKELLSKVGSVLASSHPQPLDSKRLKIRVGKLSDALAKRVPDCAKWAAENHSQYFALSTDETNATLSLTVDGVEHFKPTTSGMKGQWTHSQFALLVASMVHDLGHPARMNPFMIASKHPLTLAYAGASGPLEAMHADRFLDILRKPGHNVLEHLSTNDEQRVRESILSLVLATDLSQQSGILAEWNAKKATATAQLPVSPVPGWNVDLNPQTTDRDLFLKVVIKAADVSNPAKPLPQYLFWTNRILEEFYGQGDEEQHLGLPITSMPQCNRSKPSVAGGQKGFMMFVVKPVFEVLCDFSASVQSALPEGSSHTRGLESCMKNLMSNLDFWKRVEEEVPAEVLEVTCLPSDLPSGTHMPSDSFDRTSADFTRSVIENSYISIELAPTASIEVSAQQASQDVSSDAFPSEPAELDNVFKESEQRLNMSLEGGINPMARGSSKNLLAQSTPQHKAKAATSTASSGPAALKHVPPQQRPNSDSSKHVNRSIDSTSTATTTTTGEVFVTSLMNKASSSDLRLSALLSAQKERSQMMPTQSEHGTTQTLGGSSSSSGVESTATNSQQSNLQASAQESQQVKAAEKAAANTQMSITPPPVPSPPNLVVAGAPKRSLFDESDSSDDENGTGTPEPQKGAEAALTQNATNADPGGAQEESDDEDNLRLTMSWL